MQSESVHHHNQKQLNESEEEVVIFKFKRAFNEESFQQIKIHSKKVKPNPQNLQKASKNYQKRNFIDKESMLANLFQKLELNSNQQPQQNQTQNQKSKASQLPVNAQPLTSHKQFFLKKVQFSESKSHDPHTITQQNVQIRNHMKQIKSHVRKQELEQKFNRLRNLNINSDKNKRIKYKIIDIKQSNFVNFGGQNYEYEDLSSDYTPSQMLAHNIKYDYYILKKGKLQLNKHQNTPQIILPQQAQYLLEDEGDTQMQAETPSGSQSDSNREDRSDYEYPQEDYHEGDSEKQSEDIISGGKQKSQFDSNDDLNNSYRQEDEEEYYRQYLKRCKKQQQGDEEITYLYNFKSKYEEDSD